MSSLRRPTKSRKHARWAEFKEVPQTRSFGTSRIFFGSVSLIGVLFATYMILLTRGPGLLGQIGLLGIIMLDNTNWTDQDRSAPIWPPCHLSRKGPKSDALDDEARHCFCGAGRGLRVNLSGENLTSTQHLQLLFAKACCWRSDVMHLDTAKREALIEILSPFVEAEPAVPLGSTARPAKQEANCRHPDWFPLLLSGSPRPRLPLMIDVNSGMGGGAELDLLELRFHELHGIVDLFVISESAFNFRGDRKPRHFERQRKRFEEFLPRVVYLDLDKCPAYGDAVDVVRHLPRKRRPKNIWSIQNAQRECIWKLLQMSRPDLDNSALVIFTDLDEIPGRAAMSAIKHCTLSDPGAFPDPSIMALHLVPIAYNLRSAWGCGEGPAQTWVQGIVLTLGEVRSRRSRGMRIFLQYRAQDVRHVQRAGVHLKYFGNLGQVSYKALQHGEGGRLVLPEHESVCLAATSEQRVEAIQQLLLNHPLKVVRGWEKRWHPLWWRAPGRKVLEDCLVPHLLLESPERYPFFWGQVSHRHNLGIELGTAGPAVRDVQTSAVTPPAGRFANRSEH